MDICGKKFSITGLLSKPRAEFITMIINQGGQYSGVAKDTDYLILGKDAESNEQIKAVEYEIKMIDEKEFLSMIK